MKKLDIKSVRFLAEDGDALSISFDNRGEPYRQGITLALEHTDYRYGGSMFLESDEAVHLRDLLNNLFPPKVKPA